MSVVFIFGAGASHGESLTVIDAAAAPPATPTPTPLATGFFKQELFDSIHYPGTTAEQDYPAAFDYIRKSRLLAQAVGAGDWRTLDLEQIFTSVELERAFSNPESDRAARATLVRNQLVRYIQRTLSMCTQFCCGRYYRRLVSAVDVDDSILTFNWDLLLDQELLGVPVGSVAAKSQYNNYQIVRTGNPLSNGVPGIVGTPGRQGLFLKMHGSFNWFLCGNPKCPRNSEIALDIDTQLSLSRAMGIGVADCLNCGSEMLPLLIPPLLHKPISDNGTIRAIWGLARQRLEVASKLVLVGFSAAPTDFYAAWLLRSTVGVRNDAEVFVVNPDNDPLAPGNAEFNRRMAELFPRGFDARFRNFSQIDDILTAVYPPAAPAP